MHNIEFIMLLLISPRFPESNTISCDSLFERSVSKTLTRNTEHIRRTLMSEGETLFA